MSSSICLVRHVDTIPCVSLRYAVLGMLAVQPATGYDLARRFDASLSRSWAASHSQIYPELGHLNDEGLVEVVGEGPRRSRTYAVTEKGREALRDWLLNSEPNRAQRNETGVRWFLMPLLAPEDRIAVLEREIANADAFRAELEAVAEQLDAMESPHPFRPTVELGLRTGAVMRQWLQEQLDQAGGA
jgi:PadR family transcriptional regulator, regulatory protein AphA